MHDFCTGHGIENVPHLAHIYCIMSGTFFLLILNEIEKAEWKKVYEEQLVLEL